MSKAKIGFIVEGKKTEPEIIENIWDSYQCHGIKEKMCLAVTTHSK